MVTKCRRSLQKQVRRIICVQSAYSESTRIDSEENIAEGDIIFMDENTNSWNRPALITLLSFLTLLWLKVMWRNRPVDMGNDASDIYRLYLRNLKFYFDSIARGEFPLWNPYEFAGIPFVAYSNSALFSPYPSYTH